MKAIIIKGNANEPLFIFLEKVKDLTGNSASAITRIAIIEYCKKLIVQENENGTSTESKQK